MHAAVAVGTYMGMYLCIVFFNSNFNDLKVTVEGPGVPILSRLSESPSCWHLRVFSVSLTPERPAGPTTSSTSSSGYHHDSCIVHFLHPAHQIQAHTSTKADIAKGHGYEPSASGPY